MPSFTKAKTFAKCPLMSSGELLLFFFFCFFVNYFHACYLTYFVIVAMGFEQLCISHVEFENLSCENRNTDKKKDTIC